MNDLLTHGRACGLLYLILLGLLPGARGATEEQQPERWAVVKRETLPVHCAMNLSSALVKSLRRGDRVSVDFDLATGSEHWCQVREPGETKPVGFVLCGELDRPPAPPPTWRTEVPATPEAAAAPEGGGQRKSEAPKTMPMREYQRLLLNQFNPEFWQDRLDFSSAQREEARALAVSTGTEYCVARIARIFRTYQIFDPISLAFAGESRDFGMEVSGKLTECLPGFKKFWKQLPALMRSEQLERFKAEQQSVGRSTTSIEGGLMMYALYRANRP